MALRSRIDLITTDTLDWTCKVQIVDISRERKSPEKQILFQNHLLEDEEGQQIKVVVNGDDIAYYADKLVLLSSYLISTAWVKDLPKSYARPIHTYYWILDKETIVECINPNDKIEKTLPPPTKLNLTPLATVAQLTPTPSAELIF
ncbi:uncharacterized protein LOC124892446 [Capsicum annuum]|uniref:uncharacterized protein LOC124892446 n=1 Tax=Capsicum annuum TaxID=4072 RepID=UPI001FB10BFD|nr:uncharacterized protein LOC124892446 [Capsicum annuum]